MINLDLAEARRLTDAAARGEWRAMTYLGTLFKPTALCLTCDEPVGARGYLSCFPDPKMPGMAQLWPVCEKCALRPDRARREEAMLSAMFPLKRKRRWVRE